MPPRCRNHRLPAAGDAPAATAASSLVIPVAIARQNSRSTSRRNDGAPGDFIAERPVNSFIQPAGLPIRTSTIEVLRRPVESAQYTSWAFGRRLRDAGLLGSMGTIGDCFDNSVAESFFATLQTEVLDRRSWRSRDELGSAVFAYIEGFYNPRRRHSTLGYQSPADYESQHQAGRLTEPAA
jgi:transposase InsO family protein